MMEWLLGLAWWVGLVTVLYFVVYPLRELYKRWLRPAADLARYRKDGAWAVVTGGSDGIGKAFAEELAKRGFPVLLMARTKDKLEKVASEIGKKYGVKTAILAVDFTRIEDSATLESIEEAINKCGPVSILVNNVGMAYPFPHRFLDAPKEMDRDIMNVNVRAITDLTRIVLPGMVKRKAGAIINLSSITGRAPAPMLPTYSATKAYDYFFSVSLSAEYARDGIAVQCITPGLVASNMTRFRNKNTVKGIGTPDNVAKGSLDTLGYEIHWAPFWVHAFQIFLSKYLSRQFILDSMLRIGEEARAYRLNRQAQSKKEA